MSQYKCLFFDLDGTLSDYKAACDIILTDMHARHPEALGAITLEDWKAAYWGFFQEKEEEQRRGRIQMAELQNRELRFKSVLQRLHIADAIAEETAPALADEYDAGRQTAAALYPRSKHTLEQLQGRVPIGVITQGRGVSQRGQMDRLGITHLIDHIFVTEEVGHVKPSLDLYQACLDRVGVQPEEAIMIGDRLDWDLQPTHTLGLTTVLYTENSLYYEPGLEDDPAIDHMASSHDELLPLVQRLLGDRVAP